MIVVQDLPIDPREPTTTQRRVRYLLHVEEEPVYYKDASWHWDIETGAWIETRDPEWSQL